MSIQEIINACIEYRQEKQQYKHEPDFWTDDCFEEYYYLPSAKPFVKRIKEVVWDMCHDKSYMPEDDLKDFLYSRGDFASELSNPVAL